MNPLYQGNYKPAEKPAGLEFIQDAKRHVMNMMARQDNRLPKAMRNLIGELVGMGGLATYRQQGWIEPGLEKLAKRCGYSEETMRVHFRTLEDEGFIVRIDGRKGQGARTRFKLDFWALEQWVVSLCYWVTNTLRQKFKDLCEAIVLHKKKPKIKRRCSPQVCPQILPRPYIEDINTVRFERPEPPQYSEYAPPDPDRWLGWVPA